MVVSQQGANSSLETAPTTVQYASVMIFRPVIAVFDVLGFEDFLFSNCSA